MNDKVSIIIPVYNGEKYVKDAIESSLNQTYNNIEIIVVNDGSTDGTKSILEKYQGEPKITILEKENGGVSSALNMGISVASGYFFQWLSHDDMLERDSIEEKVKFIKKNNDKTIVCSRIKNIDSKGKKIFKLQKNAHNVKNISDLVSGGINGCSLLIPMQALKKHSFDENLVYMQDYFVWASLINDGFNFKLLKKKLTLTRRHKDQTSKKRADTFHNDFSKFFDEFILTIDNLKESKKILLTLGLKANLYSVYKEKSKVLYDRLKKSLSLFYKIKYLIYRFIGLIFSKIR